MPRDATPSAFRRALPGTACDLAGVAGVALISYGAWLVYAPAGYIVAGLLFVAGAMILGRKFEAPRA
jgi:hypothetical protein